MAKSKPIGVRFNQELLSELKEKDKKMSPQKALNLYEEVYQERNNPFQNAARGRDESGVNEDEISPKPKKTKGKKSEIAKENVTGEPVMQPGESGLDFSIRKAEWKQSKSK